MKLDAYTAHGGSCIDSKRIYIIYDFTWTCPECKHDVVESAFNTVPFISYGNYCHIFSCKKCDFESIEKMYTLNSIGFDFVDVTLSTKYNFKIN